MILYKNINKLDLHGYDRDSARILINEFIYDNYKLKNKKVVIIHGVGSGILKNTTHKVLKNNKYVNNYKLDNFNVGMTIVDINI
ncbi:MAG: Smr/MutS family protein [Bacilli bacterium]|nr:Smr/MutS family protein [Bacilli bacterium]